MNQEERTELVTRMFAVMTMKLEDAAGEAVEGQAHGLPRPEQIARAERIEAIARDVGLIAEAAAALLRTETAAS
jgi:pseudouridine-5'-phosphate glycosidase